MDISETVEAKGHEKCIFETPHNEIKYVLSVKESKSMKKWENIFSSAYGQGRVGLRPKTPVFLVKKA